LGSIIDFDAGLNYHFNKSFSAFASVNNLLSPNYQMWYNYPVKGFGAIIGLAYLF
jgi:outer membrane cobalamin receptor